MDNNPERTPHPNEQALWDGLDAAAPDGESWEAGYSTYHQSIEQGKSPEEARWAALDASAPDGDLWTAGLRAMDTVLRSRIEQQRQAASVAPEMEQSRNWMEFEGFAKDVDPDELVRERGNNGDPLDAQYLENNRELRDFFVETIADGSLYHSPEAFTHLLKEGHFIATAHDVYNRIGQGSYLDQEDIGVFRGPGRLQNGRYTSAQYIADIARYYGDPYAERFAEGQTSVPFDPNLTNIAGSEQPFDVGGSEQYSFFYPDGEAIPNYLKKITDLGQEIIKELQSPEPDRDKAIGLIANQYRYGAVIRPFKQVNNSLFMNLANAQLKLFGINGITHGDMDHAAQRLQRPAFVNYFHDRVDGIAY